MSGESHGAPQSWLPEGLGPERFREHEAPACSRLPCEGSDEFQSEADRKPVSTTRHTVVKAFCSNLPSRLAKSYALDCYIG